MARPELKHGTKPIHEGMIDAIIAQPAIRPVDLAAMFGYSVEGIRILMRTDAFREKLTERKEELVDPLLTAKVEDRLNALADLSIQRLLEKLGNPQVSDELALKAADLSTRALGYGARQSQAAVTNYIAVVPATSPSAQTWVETYQGTGEPEARRLGAAEGRGLAARPVEPRDAPG